MSSLLKKCTNCGCFKALSAFGVIQGNSRLSRAARPRKTCEVCLNRRRQRYEASNNTNTDYPALTIDEFLAKISNHATGVELNIKCTINITETSGSIDDFAASIGESDGFMWFKEQNEVYHRADGATTSTYRCSQRHRTIEDMGTARQRYRRPRDSYQCNGRVTIFQRGFDLRVLFVHKIHPAPRTVAIRDQAVRNYIVTMAQEHSPPEIMQLLIRGALPSSDITGLTTSAIYNVWLNATSGLFQRHQNPHQSAQILIPELQNLSLLFFYPSPTNKPRVAVSTVFLSEVVHQPVVECYVDDTRGLEHAGLKMYSIMGLVGTKAVPISYFFCGAGNEPGDTSRWLEEWFQTLRNNPTNPLKPTILFSDKDKAQMAAAENVWGSNIIRLCLWHVRDAVTRKLNRQASAQSERQQRLTEADLLLLDLTSQGQVVDLDWVRSGSSVSLNQDARTRVLNRVIQHGARHPALEGIDFEEIHDQCLVDIYRLIRELDKPAMFRYLYLNWYRRDLFGKWSMAGGPQLSNFIPIGRTTMVVESHWNDLKNRWFRHSYRPRLDYIFYKLDSDVLPAIAHRLRNFATDMGNDPPSWWRAFRNIWAESIDTEEENEPLALLRTDLMQWKCSCTIFRQSHVLLCSHLATLAIERCPSLTNIHWSQIIRNQFPPYLSIDRIHQNQVNDSNSNAVIYIEEEVVPERNTTTILIHDIPQTDRIFAEPFDESVDAITELTLPTLAQIGDRYVLLWHLN